MSYKMCGSQVGFHEKIKKQNAVERQLQVQPFIGGNMKWPLRDGATISPHVGSQIVARLYV